MYTSSELIFLMEHINFVVYNLGMCHLNDLKDQLSIGTDDELESTESMLLAHHEYDDDDDDIFIVLVTEFQCWRVWQ